MTLKPFPGMLLGQPHSAPPGFPNEQWNTTSSGWNGVGNVNATALTHDPASINALQAIALYGQASSKFYAEFKPGVGPDGGKSWVGVAPALAPLAAPGATNFGSAGYGAVLGTDGVMIKTDGGAGRSLTGSIAAGHVIMVASDHSAHKVWFGVDAVWLNGTPGVSGGDTIGSGTFYPVGALGSVTGQSRLNAYWGTAFTPFNYTPPTGFNAWHS